MGNYLNPGNSGFAAIRNGIYVDKSGMIDLINKTIDTTEKLTCVSRPRRFGKSFAAKMLCAYYDRSCDSSALFEDLQIATDSRYVASYRKHLNQYDVIYLDMTAVIGETSFGDLVPYIKRNVIRELAESYPEARAAEGFVPTLANTVQVTGTKFIMIIDEWDAPIREGKDETRTQREYLEFLRALFKNSGATDKVFAAVYITGILPMKKDGSQSAISDFREVTTLNPGRFVEFTGFTERDVRSLCGKYGMDFRELRQWYDGYDFPGYGAIYNPYSVMCAMQEQKCRSYWQKTSAAESLMTYINMDFEGLQETISRLISGEEVEVDTDFFENDFESFKSRDDVLTLLIHLGYLTWQEDDGTARIPNEEVRIEFRKILKGTNVNRKWMELLGRSEKLLEDTIAEDAEAVAKAVEEIRDSQYAPTYYNDEQALRYVIKFAYIAALDQYLKVEELPSGKGIADVVYLPKRRSTLPALVVELKWNRPSEGAIRQIKERNYPAILQDYDGEIVLVGIGYDAKKKAHSCVIERI